MDKVELRAVKLLRHKRAMPAENCIALDKRGHVLQRLLPQLLANLSQGLPLAITQPNASWELITQNTILRHQVLIV
jgi:hypothetical protein